MRADLWYYTLACASAHDSGRSRCRGLTPAGMNVRIERGIKMDLVKTLSEKYMKPELPEMNVGDTVRVTVRVKEGNRVRNQAFDGTIIAKSTAASRDHHRPPHQLRRPAARRSSPYILPTIVSVRDSPPRQGPPRQALLPARPRGQEGQGQGAHLTQGRMQNPPYPGGFLRRLRNAAPGAEIFTNSYCLRGAVTV